MEKKKKAKETLSLQVQLICGLQNEVFPSRKIFRVPLFICQLSVILSQKLAESLLHR